MGSLKKISFFILLALSVLFVAIPFLRLLVTLVINFETYSLSIAFVTLVAKSLFYTSLQAFLSALLTIGATFSLAVIFSHSSPSTLLDRILRTLGGFGNFVFFLPSLSAALFILFLNKHIPAFPSQGLWAVVGAHFFINFFFLFGRFYIKFKSHLQGSGEKVFQAAWLMGAPRFKIYLLVWSSLAKNEFRSWFPLIFWWSFSNFSTLLILGGLQYSSPEILLFLSIQNDPTSTRILILIFVQLLVGFFVSGTFLRHRANSENYEITSALVPSLPKQKNDWLFCAVALAVLILVFLPQCYFFLRALAVPLQSSPPEIILTSLAPSFLFATFSSVLVLCFATLLCFAPTQFRRIMTLFLGFSAATLCVSYVSTDLIQSILHNKAASFFIMSLVQALLFLPTAALWLSPRIDSLPTSQKQAAFCLGLGEWGFFKWVLWPQSSELWMRLGLLCFVSGLGEILVTTLFMPETEFLATAARKLSSRYAFDEAQWIIVVYSVTVATGLGLVFLLQKRRRKIIHEL